MTGYNLLSPLTGRRTIVATGNRQRLRSFRPGPQTEAQIEALQAVLTGPGGRPYTWTDVIREAVSRLHSSEVLVAQGQKTSRKK